MFVANNLLKSKMNFDWESDEERLKKFMKIPAKKKPERLRQMLEFTVKTSSKRQRSIRWKLRGLR